MAGPEEVDSKLEQKWKDREKEREKECVCVCVQQAEKITAKSGRNEAKSGSRPHLMKNHKYNRLLPFSFPFSFICDLHFFLCQLLHTHTPHTHTHIYKFLYSIAAFAVSA